MTVLTTAEQAVLDRAASAPMLAQVEAWAAINSGTTNLDGLADLAGRLADAFSILPGTVALVDPDPVDSVDSKGHLTPIRRGQHLAPKKVTKS